LADKRLAILAKLKENVIIAGIVNHASLGLQIFLWMSPNEEVFPRIVVREVDNASNRAADNFTIWSRQTYEISFTTPTNQVENFITLCNAIPDAMKAIGGKLIGSGGDTLIAEHRIVNKTQIFEFYSDEEEEE